MVLDKSEDPERVVPACREFVALCREESAQRGLIVSVLDGEAAPMRLREGLTIVAGAAPDGFKLAIVARGPSSRRIHHGSERALTSRRLRTKVFRSEHDAAAWLLC